MYVSLLCEINAAIEKTGSYHGDNNAASLGDEITYVYTISNEGTTTMSSLVLKDSAVSSSRVPAPGFTLVLFLRALNL